MGRSICRPDATTLSVCAQAPEMKAKQPYDLAADWYSLGDTYTHTHTHTHIDQMGRSICSL